MAGKQKLRTKGEGKGVMVSAFLNEQLGFLSISYKQLEKIISRRVAINKQRLKFYVEHEQKINPSIHLFEHGKIGLAGRI